MNEVVISNIIPSVHMGLAVDHTQIWLHVLRITILIKYFNNYKLYKESHIHSV